MSLYPKWIKMKAHFEFVSLIFNILFWLFGLSHSCIRNRPSAHICTAITVKHFRFVNFFGNMVLKSD